MQLEQFQWIGRRREHLSEHRVREQRDRRDQRIDLFGRDADSGSGSCLRLRLRE
jgi:hypothetical protein